MRACASAGPRTKTDSLTCMTHTPEPILRFPVYEPAGRDVLLTEQDLLQHLLVIGATGTGKTSLLHRLMDQLIRKDVGLLIYDAKQDDTIERVQTMAQASGRELVVLGPGGDHYLDLFAPLRSLADVDLMTTRLLSGSGSMGADNAYWDETRAALIDAALTLLVTSRNRVHLGSALRLMRELFFGTGLRTPELDQALPKMTNFWQKADFSERMKIDQAMDSISLWRNLDSRTRSNVQSTLMNFLRPLLTVSASHCFAPMQRPAFAVEEIAHRGALCVVSVNATVSPDLASLVFKLVKGDFFRAVQTRKGTQDKLCGLVADELPLSVTPDDVYTLATVRSRRCFIAGATQGLASLDERLGIRRRNALLLNFGTMVLLRTREEEVDHYAAVHLGTREEAQTVVLRSEEGSVVGMVPGKVFRRVPICPPGTLGRLQPHQGFVLRSSERQDPFPTWFVPWFEDERVPPTPPPTAQADPAEVGRLASILKDLGFRQHLDLVALASAFKLGSEDNVHVQALEKARAFFRRRAIIVPAGLETLPTPWLKGLPGILWSLRRPGWTHLPYMIHRVAVVDGLLQLRFAQEPGRSPGENRISACDRVRVAVNAALYPNVWRRLNRRDIRRLAAQPKAIGPAGVDPTLV